jgi:hypothetical protein
VPYLCVTLVTQKVFYTWSAEECAEKYNVTWPFITMWSINRRWKRGINVLRKSHRKKLSRIFEKGISLILMCRETLSAMASNMVSVNR